MRGFVLVEGGEERKGTPRERDIFQALLRIAEEEARYRREKMLELEHRRLRKGARRPRLGPRSSSLEQMRLR